MGGEIVFYIWINCQCLKIIRFHCFSWKSWQLRACTPTWRPSAGSGGGCSCLQWHLLFVPHCLRHSWVFTLQSGLMSSVPGHLHLVHFTQSSTWNHDYVTAGVAWGHSTGNYCRRGCTWRGRVLGCPVLLQVHPFVVGLSASVRADRANHSGHLAQLGGRGSLRQQLFLNCCEGTQT